MTSSRTTSSEKILIANHMKTKQLNSRQRSWVNRQIVDKRTTKIVDITLLLITVLGWFWVIWVGIGL